jgi:hypothetical protein
LGNLHCRLQQGNSSESGWLGSPLQSKVQFSSGEQETIEKSEDKRAPAPGVSLHERRCEENTAARAGAASRRQHTGGAEGAARSESPVPRGGVAGTVPPHNAPAHLGDARDLSWIPDASVHLVVTSPPYWTLKDYAPGNQDQMGHFEDYERSFRSWIGSGKSVSASWWEAGGFVVSWAMCVSLESARGVTTWFRCTPIFRCAPVSSVSIACSRSSGTRSLMAPWRPKGMGRGSTGSRTSRAESSRTISSTFYSFARAGNIGPRHAAKSAIDADER